LIFPAFSGFDPLSRRRHLSLYYQDKRDRGDHADTIKLTTRTITGLESYWRALATQGRFDELAQDAERAVRFYVLFGGVRRQLRRLIRSYKKLYEAKLKRDWPGPDPEKLPSIGKFRKQAGKTEEMAATLSSTPHEQELP
jgi:hypothetical protein